MAAVPRNKKRLYTRDQFEDKEVYNQIKDEIKIIREQNLKQVEQESKITLLYETKKQELKRRKMQTRPKAPKERNINQLGQEDEEQGQIRRKVEQAQQEMIEQSNVPSTNDLGKDIRPITITRNKMTELFKSRKFQDLIRGCFVRYKAENSTSNTYMLALVIGLFQGEKQYTINNIKTKKMLRLQQSSSEIIKLSLDHVSNQHPPGSLEISKWIRQNRTKIPRQTELKAKLSQLNNLINDKVSSQDIDRNLLTQANRVASGKGEGNQNISELIFFMRGHLHDIVMTLEEMEGDKQKKNDFDTKTKEKQRAENILNKLIAKQEQLKQILKATKQQTDKKAKSKSLLDYGMQDRRQDKIKQKYHENLLALSSYQGCLKLQAELKMYHRSFELQIDI